MNKKAFTVIEIVVAVTILSIVLISVMQIYISSADINLKTDVNRALQQNIKSAIETIAEDVRKNWVDKLWLNSCDVEVGTGSYLCINSNRYALWSKTGDIYNIDNNCDSIENECSILKNNKPLTNSWVHIRSLEFKVDNLNDLSKVTILMSVQPSTKKWIKSSLIENNIVDFQTTIVERPFLN